MNVSPNDGPSSRCSTNLLRERPIFPRNAEKRASVFGSYRKPEISTARPIGEMLMTGYALPFEVASVILLVAMIGAAFMARRPKKL